MINDMTFSQQVDFIARVHVLLDKTTAWQRGELILIDDPNVPERARKRMEEKVLTVAWHDIMQEAEQYKPQGTNTPL